jgi:diacylglycerol kinase (ATP)
MLDFPEMKQLLFIVNPVSGKRLALKYLPEIIRIFFDGGYLVTVMVTSRQGDASEFARLYGSSFDLLVCIGGDGTFNEVVTGLARGGVCVDLGYIPAGSTNDFAACHGLSSEALAAARSIINGDVRHFDVGRFGERYFTYVAAFGAFSWLSYTTPQNLKNVLGHSAYILDAVKNLSKVKSEWLSFTADGHIYEGSYIFGAICSSTSVAGTFELPRDIVDTSDGKFEVILIQEPPTIIDYQEIVRCMLEQDYSACPYIDFFQASQITVNALKKHTDWSLDGEHAVAPSHLEVENLRCFMALKG